MKTPRHVYVATDQAGRHKIGVTGNLRLREYHLTRGMGSPVKIIHADGPHLEAEAIEQTAHWLLADQHDWGEWFNVAKARAVEAIEQAKARVASGEHPTVRLLSKRRGSLGHSLEAGIRAELVAGETRIAFIREAVEREIKRRSRGKGPG